MSGTRVLRLKRRVTQSSYRAKVAEIIKTVGAEYRDAELAEILGCSATTIGNARNENADLSAVTLAKIASEFGPDAIQPFMELFGCVAVPLNVNAANDMATIASLSHVTGDWVERIADGVRCHNDTLALADKLRPLLSALSALVEEADRIREAA